MSAVSELRLAARTLRRAPGSALIAVLALGLGIGLSTLIFSIVQGAMLRGLPFDEPDEIVTLMRADRARGANRLATIHDYVAWSEATRSVETMGAFTTGTLNLGDDASEEPERLSAGFITPSVLRLLGVQPVAGRLLDDGDDVTGAPSVLLLGWEVWQRRYGGDPSIIGRVVRANGEETVVVGVLPEGFGFPQSQQAWQPLRMDAARVAWGAGLVQVVARLRDGMTPVSALPELDAIAARIAAEHPDTHRGLGVRITGFTSMGDQDRAMLFVMLAAVAAVLVIACVNVANLLIGRAIVRTKEVGIRTALGASRWQVALPFLAESAVLAAAGALVGTAVAYVGIGIFVRQVAPHDPPFWIRFVIDGQVLAFVALAAIAAAVLAGVVPALQAARLSLGDTLKDESRGASSFRLGRLSRGLVVAEIALSLALLVGAGLLIRSVLRLSTIDVGVPADEVLIARVGLPVAGYGEADAQRAFIRDLETRLATLPGSAAFSLSASVPGRFGSNTWVDLEGAPADGSERAYANIPVVSPGYFPLFDAAPLRGRTFTAADGPGAPDVAVVSAAFERRYFGGGDALGRRVRIGGENAPWLTVVGVVPDLLEGGIHVTRPESVYRPVAQSPTRFLTIAARPAGRAPLDLVDPLREAVRALDTDLPLYDVATLRTAIAGDNFRYGIFSGLFAAFGGAALLLAAVGLYGVMSFSVGQRRREVGVRMAIGAGTRDVLRLILGQGMRQVGIGLAIGALLALGLARLIASTLYRTSPSDPATFTAIALLLLGVALVACGVPALRATRVDPLEALRSE